MPLKATMLHSTVLQTPPMHSLRGYVRRTTTTLLILGMASLLMLVWRMRGCTYAECICHIKTSYMQGEFNWGWSVSIKYVWGWKNHILFCWVTRGLTSISTVVVLNSEPPPAKEKEGSGKYFCSYLLGILVAQLPGLPHCKLLSFIHHIFTDLLQFTEAISKAWLLAESIHGGCTKFH